MKTLKSLSAGSKFKFPNKKGTFIVTRNEIPYETSMFYKKMGTDKLVEIRNAYVGTSKFNAWNRCAQEVEEVN